jgi:hypothetical protein
MEGAIGESEVFRELYLRLRSQFPLPNVAQGTTNEKGETVGSGVDWTSIP